MHILVLFCHKSSSFEFPIVAHRLGFILFQCDWGFFFFFKKFPIKGKLMEPKGADLAFDKLNIPLAI